MEALKLIKFNETFKVVVDVPESMAANIEIALHNMFVFKKTCKKIKKPSGYDEPMYRITYECNLSNASEIHKKLKELSNS